MAEQLFSIKQESELLKSHLHLGCVWLLPFHSFLFPRNLNKCHKHGIYVAQLCRHDWFCSYFSFFPPKNQIKIFLLYPPAWIGSRWWGTNPTEVWWSEHGGVGFSLCTMELIYRQMWQGFGISELASRLTPWGAHPTQDIPINVWKMIRLWLIARLVSPKVVKQTIAF